MRRALLVWTIWAAGWLAVPITAQGQSAATGPGARFDPLTSQTLDFSALPQAAVTRIIDGDTVVLALGGREVTCRLLGIDTPELHPPGGGPQPYAVEAARFTENLLKGERVWVVQYPAPFDVGAFRRMLALLYRVPDGLMVNLEIIRQGYGEVYAGSEVFPGKALLRTWENFARGAEKGLWDSRAMAGTAAGNSTFDAQPDVRDGVVYVTPSGERYHRADCPCIRVRSTAMTIPQARTRGLTPCKTCNPPAH